MPRLLEANTVETLAATFVRFLETNEAPEGLFRPDVFLDLTVPQWRLQGAGVDAVVAIRRNSHPARGRVPRWRVDPTPTGFVLEFEERWHDADGDWYCREMARADVVDGAIAALAVYCTGDWDEALVARHRQEVALSRP